jgi:hypothetical protein
VKVFWVTLKVLGMLFVIGFCNNSVYHMSVAGGAMGHPMPMVVVSLFFWVLFVYWAYRVIWKPITSRKVSRG